MDFTHKKLSIMEENNVIDMEDTQIEDQPTYESETTQQTEEFEINTSTTDTVVDVTVPKLEPTKTDGDIYNPQTSQSVNTEDERELCTFDCSSECKYNTGKTSKSSDYGYSD